MAKKSFLDLLIHFQYLTALTKDINKKGINYFSYQFFMSENH